MVLKPRTTHSADPRSSMHSTGSSVAFAMAVRFSVTVLLVPIEVLESCVVPRGVSAKVGKGIRIGFNGWPGALFFSEEFLRNMEVHGFHGKGFADLQKGVFREKFGSGVQAFG